MIIARISDSHITQVRGTADHKYATATRLQRAVAHLTRLPASPDVVLVTGDCVDRGSVVEYERFRDLLRPLTMPVYVIPGNHDDRVHLREVFGTQGAKPMAGFVQYVVDEGPVRLIALDTNVPGHHAGYLCAERLRWLEERLSEAPARPTVIFLHHPPFLTGLQVFDQRGLEGAESFGALVARSPNPDHGRVNSRIAARGFVSPGKRKVWALTWSPMFRSSMVRKFPPRLIHVPMRTSTCVSSLP
jgi:3',5'-cyclic-AMP phosphodiesterase